MTCPESPLARPDNALLLSRHRDGYRAPAPLPWSTEPLFRDGRIILPGASGAAAGIATSAAAAAAAEGISVASSPIQAEIATFEVPTSFVGVVTAILVRPLSTLGYDSGHVTFGFRANGRLSNLPDRFFGLKWQREQPFKVNYVAPPKTSFTLIATNGSSATWHAVEGFFEGFLMRQDLYRQLIGEDA